MRLLVTAEEQAKHFVPTVEIGVHGLGAFLRLMQSAVSACQRCCLDRCCADSWNRDHELSNECSCGPVTYVLHAAHQQWLHTSSTVQRQQRQQQWADYRVGSLRLPN